MELGLTGIIAFILLFGSTCFADFENEFEGQMFRYAHENSPTVYLKNNAILESENFVANPHFYFESGPRGAWSFDPDPMRFSFSWGEQKQSTFWIGRDHPLNLTRPQGVGYTSALGNVWAQNTTDALNPRVSGWVGLGVVQEIIPGLKINAAYSPVFLPSFGPSLGVSDIGTLTPSRYARLPPSSVNTGNNTLPILYQIQIGKLSDIVLQNQAFVALTHDDENINTDVYFFSAPNPNAVTPHTDTLQFSNENVNAHVLVNPQFPRQNWAGGHFQVKSVWFQPNLEFVQDVQNQNHHMASITGYFSNPGTLISKYSPKASFGLLTHFGGALDSADLSDTLVFVRIPIRILESLTWSHLIEATLLTGRQSFYWMNELQYAIQKGFYVLAGLRLMYGQDESYFGDWRNNDSYSLGVRWVW